ncbi:mitochondrial carrier domain-containing protein [Protomyces lactucae-debilis]|uniref:Mitochondrial carrier domain-containing protein n=1 Tax=Protomyces lactucae-debilis TaxID=2754530 RepID=A0A1Y2ES52_PROLT|nr:mitochondrial carrier domain-containing protein [Protomyces lactucae-debilis]ORY74347.1 mitochondrial carrier domain-containing protein [Protomyces lactucae-debilis]
MSAIADGTIPKKKPVSYSNLLLGAGLNMFEVSTLGQPFEVLKTHMAANRSDGLLTAFSKTWGRGGVFGFYQGLIPWAWIEASSKGAVLLFTASEIEYLARVQGASPFTAGILGGMGGGVAQAYATMGFCTNLKTAEITRHKAMTAGVAPPSTFKVFADIWKAEGMRGINRGVNAVAIRQCTNWGSRIGLSRLAEDWVRTLTKKEKGQGLSVTEKIGCSAVGGGLSCWNQPIEIIRVEMQSMKKDPSKPSGLGVGGTLKYIYSNSGIKGLYRGVTPRVCLGIWQTLCMVTLGDYAKLYVEKLTGEKATAKH